MLPYYDTKSHTKKRKNMSNNLSAKVIQKKECQITCHLGVLCVVLRYGKTQKKRKKRKDCPMTCYWEQSAWSKKIVRGGGGDVLWHTSRMKSPVLSPARSALLPGSTLSRYCRAGNSAEGRKSSSTAVAWVCAVKQIQKYKSCNFNSSDIALIPTHFLNNERNICSKFLSSILHVFESQGFSVRSIFGEWSELMTLGLQRWLQEKKIKKYNIYILIHSNVMGRVNRYRQQPLNFDPAAVAASFFWTPSPVWVWPPQHSTPFSDKHYLLTSLCSPFTQR